jgi:DNA-binding transcriptional regulator YhcF (GntR family)
MKQNTSQRIAAELKQRIRAGRIKPGEAVPSAREIVREWGVAIATASKVLALLRKEGLVRAQRGVGTIVRSGERSSGLARDQVVRAGIAIADDEGIDALSLRQVAVELGVATVVVHEHFASKDELVLAMVDTVLGEVPLRRAKDWRGTIEGIAHAQFAAYAQHVWMVGTLSMTRPQLLPNGMHHTEMLLAAIDSLGLSAELTLRTGVMLLSYVRGMAVGLEAERQAQQDTGMTSDEWMQAREPLFAPLVPRFPTLGRLTKLGDVDMSLEALFARGLTLLLDGLAVGAARPRSRRSRAASSLARPPRDSTTLRR